MGTIGVAFYQSKDFAFTFGQEGFVLEGISVGIAAAITAVVDMPTYFRHARSRIDSRIAVAIFLPVAVPMIEGLGIYLASKNPDRGSIQEVLTGGGSAMWQGWDSPFFTLSRVDNK